MTRIKLFSTSVLFALTVSHAGAFGESDRLDTRIDATRLGMMMDQSQSALTSLKLSRPDQKQDTPDAEREATFNDLVSAVLAYNRILDEVCRPATVDEKLCTGHYLPRWLSQKPGRLNNKQLRRMTDEASGRLLPLWDAICGKAKAADPHTEICLIE